MRNGSLILLPHLRRAAGLEGLALRDQGSVLGLGVRAIDAALGGGLRFGALHEISPSASLGLGAAAGFALILAALTRRDRPVLWIQTDFAAAERGALYGPGLELIGLAMERLVVLRVPRPVDVLWAKEEALKSRAVAAVVAELPEDVADLNATRRLSLAAREGGLGLLLRHRSSALPSAAVTRWEVAAAPSESDGNGLGRTAFDLSLTKNRRGPCGRWIVGWDHHERAFIPALSLGVAETARDRHRVPLVRAG